MRIIRNGILAISALLVAPAAWGATATITISGSVDASTQITATAAPALSNDELVNGVTDKPMSSVNEKCNKHDGYTVMLESANAKAASSSQARMNGAIAANSSVINYTIKYDGATVTLDNTGAAKITDATEKTGGQGIDKPLAISIAAGQNPAADTYSDTLTLTIAAK